jgi:hypothetical protein
METQRVIHRHAYTTKVVFFTYACKANRYVRNVTLLYAKIIYYDFIGWFSFSYATNIFLTTYYKHNGWGGEKYNEFDHVLFFFVSESRTVLVD